MQWCLSHAVQPELPKLQKSQLFTVLRGFGEYPAKYRDFIWRFLLRLPDNHTAYNALLAKVMFILEYSHYLVVSDSFSHTG